MSTPTPRTDRAWNVHGDIAEAAWSLARKLERELTIERSTLAGVIEIKRGVERDLAAERETSRLRLLAMHEREDGFAETRKRLSALETALAAEREKVRTLRSACESICEEWGKNHDAPFCAGGNMEKHATAALAATEDAP